MGPAVMGCLAEILREAREDTDAKYVEIAAHMGRVENVVRRFEKGESAPKFGEIDSLVAAYAAATGVSVRELWRRAIDRAAEIDAHARMDEAESEAAKIPQARRKK